MATFKIYKTRSGTRYGVLSGGATGDYKISELSMYYSTRTNADGSLLCTDTRPAELGSSVCKSFARVRIAADVTSIGDYCFAFFENADFTLENAANIRHLGSNAFYCAGIRGKVSLSGLTDTVLSNAFNGCAGLTELELSGSTVTQIDASALTRCHNLRRVSGCENVKFIGARAFTRCASLQDIDLNRATVQSIGYSAFHITSIGTLLDGYDASVFAIAATRKQKFDAATLAAMQAVELPDIGGVPKTTKEQTLPDVPYRLIDGEPDYMVNGCMMLSTYHAYQCIYPNAGFADFTAWWDEVNARCFAKYGDHIYERERSWDILYAVVDLMDMQLKDFSNNAMCNPNYSEALMTHDASAKMEIRDALAAGYGVIVNISSGEQRSEEGALPFANNHMVAVVGCKDGKLIVVDSASINGDAGGVYCVAYEDLFMGASAAQNDIRVLMPKEVSV